MCQQTKKTHGHSLAFPYQYLYTVVRSKISSETWLNSLLLWELHMWSLKPGSAEAEPSSCTQLGHEAGTLPITLIAVDLFHRLDTVGPVR
jgi:hypothetical protein